MTIARCDPAEVGGEALAPPQLDVEGEGGTGHADKGSAGDRGQDAGPGHGTPAGERRFGPFTHAAQRQTAPRAVQEERCPDDQ